MLACALVVTVPAVVAVATVPLTLAPVMLLIVLPLPLNCPAVSVPLTLNDVNVPTLVIFDCAFVVTVAAVPTALPADSA